MNLKVALALCIAWGTSLSSRADVECRVVCSGPQSCLEAGVGGTVPVSTPTGYRLPDCNTGTRKTNAPASVWYSRKTMLVSKPLAKDASVASAVADGDHACSSFSCLFKLRSGRVSGANPMGEKTDIPTSPAAVAAGLPFEDVAVPAEGLSIRVEAPAAGGGLVLTDASGQRHGPYPAADGRVLVPAEVLKPGDPYAYRWEAPGVGLQGSFTVARPGTVNRANAAAQAMAAADPSPASTKLALASVYLRVGMPWNARQLIGEVERGE